MKKLCHRMAKVLVQGLVGGCVEWPTQAELNTAAPWLCDPKQGLSSLSLEFPICMVGCEDQRSRERLLQSW